MRYRRFGRTALDVSALGFGASSLGNVDWNSDPAESCRESAAEVGANVGDAHHEPDAALLAHVRAALGPARHFVWLSGRPENQDAALP